LAAPWLGNPVLSFVGRLLFKIQVHDFHCGLRGFNAQAIRGLEQCTAGMEYAMVGGPRGAGRPERGGSGHDTAPTAARGPHLRTWWTDGGILSSC
jgi:hypothetical protein